MGAGIASGTWGYALGRQALRGITQPDGSPSKQMGQAKANSEVSGEETMRFMDETELIESVKARISGKEEPTPSASSSPTSAAPSSSPEAAIDNSEGFTAVDPVATPVVDSSEETVEDVASTEGDGSTWADSGNLSTEPETVLPGDPFAEAEPFLESEPTPAAEP